MRPGLKGGGQSALLLRHPSPEHFATDRLLTGLVRDHHRHQYLALGRGQHPFRAGAGRNPREQRLLGIGVWLLGLAVLYRPLPGDTLRNHWRRIDAEQRSIEVRQFGAFLAHLHQSGVYFRSLHLGNVLYTPDGDFGLIDFLDIRFKSRPLRPTLIRRNFEHLRGYLLRRSVQNFPWDELMRCYDEASKASS